MSVYRCNGGGKIEDLLIPQALAGGRKGMSQLAIAELYLSNMMTDGKVNEGDAAVRFHRELPGTLGKLLDLKLVDEQMAGRPESEKEYVRGRVRAALAVFKDFNAKGPAEEDPLGAWLDAWEKEPEIFKAALAVRRTDPRPAG